MDSLLASYGSDEEDADSLPGSPTLNTSNAVAPVVSATRHSIFGSLPPPRNSAPETSVGRNGNEQVKSLKRKASDDDLERVGLRSSLFASLPPPKVHTAASFDAGEPLTKSGNATRDDGVQPASGGMEKKRAGFVLATSSPPRFNPPAMPSDFFNDSTNFSPAEICSPDEEILTGRPERPASLFAQLPPPTSSNSLFGRLPPPSTSKPQVEKMQKKKLVEFKPPVDFSKLENTEEDDLEPRKRPQVSHESGQAAGGLAALLPPPKNSLGAGAGLGGGGTHGRRNAMETASDTGGFSKVTNGGPEAALNSGRIPHKLQPSHGEKAEVNSTGPARGHGFEPISSSSEASSGQYESNYSHIPGEGYSGGNEHDQSSWHYPESGARSRSLQGEGNVPLDPLAEAMKKERRKGRDELPFQMIEVKQADLTGGARLRQEQIRPTGNAYGPSYQPVSSNKEKPSKLHRRKHQIGALFFDMKQNEMNLMDRRAKGSLTKAETQAKYGW